MSEPDFSITFCAYDGAGYFGGPLEWYKRLGPALRDVDVEARFLFITDHKPEFCGTHMGLKEAGFTCHALPRHSLTQLRDNTEARVRWILGQLRADPPDLFVPNLSVPGCFAGRWAQEAGIPAVPVIHSDDPFYAALVERFLATPGPFRLQAAVCVSEMLAESVRKRCQGEGRGEIVPPPAPPEGTFAGGTAPSTLTSQLVAEPGIRRSESASHIGTSDFRPPTSDLRPPTSDAAPPTFRPPTSDLRPPTSDPAPPTLIERIPCGTPIPAAKTRWPGDGPFRIAYVGRVVEVQKRSPDLARAFCRAVREVPDVQALIIGNGPEQATVADIVERGGCTDRVRLVGRIDSAQVQEYLLGSHVIVLLSDFEGLPIALIEGMACGLVPVCLDIRSGIPELVKHEETGLLVHDRGDDFVGAIRRLREDRDLWERLSKGARALVESGYSMEVVARQWRDLAERLGTPIGERRPVRVPRRLDLPPVQPGLAAALRSAWLLRGSRAARSALGHVVYTLPGGEICRRIKSRLGGRNETPPNGST